MDRPRGCCEHGVWQITLNGMQMLRPVSGQPRAFSCCHARHGAVPSTSMQMADMHEVHDAPQHAANLLTSCVTSLLIRLSMVIWGWYQCTRISPHICAPHVVWFKHCPSWIGLQGPTASIGIYVSSGSIFEDEHTAGGWHVPRGAQ